MTIDDIFHQVLEARTAAGAASGAMEAASGSAKGKGAERKGELSLLYEMLVCVLWGASASLRAHPLPPAPPPHAAAATVPEAAAAAAAEAAAARAPSPAFLPSRLSGRHARTDALLTSLFAGARLRTTDISIAANLVAADPAYVLPEDVARRLLGAIDAFARGQKREAAGAARLEVGAQLKAAELGEHTQLEAAERRAGMSRSPNRKARLAAVVTADASPVAHPTYAELRRVDAAASILSTLLLRHLVSERAHRALLWPVSAIELTLTALVRLDAGASHAEGGVDEPSTEASEPRPVPKPAPTLAAADGAAPSTSAVPADAAAMPMVVGAVEARAEAVMVRGMGADAAEDGDGYNEEEDTYFDSDRAQSELRTRILDEAIELGLADPDRVDPFADEYTSEAQMTMNLLKGAHGSASASSETFGSAAIKDAVAADTGGVGPLQKHAFATLAALLMAQLCGGATAAEPVAPYSLAEQAVLTTHVPMILRMLGRSPVAAIHHPMLAAGLWGLARHRELRPALVSSGAVEVLLGAIEKLCNTALAGAGAGAAGAARDEHGRGSDREALLDWSVSVLWLLCDDAQAMAEAAQVEAETPVAEAHEAEEEYEDEEAEREAAAEEAQEEAEKEAAALIHASSPAPALSKAEREEAAAAAEAVAAAEAAAAAARQAARAVRAARRRARGERRAHRIERLVAAKEEATSAALARERLFAADEGGRLLLRTLGGAASYPFLTSRGMGLLLHLVLTVVRASLPFAAKLLDGGIVPILGQLGTQSSATASQRVFAVRVLQSLLAHGLPSSNQTPPQLAATAATTAAAPPPPVAAVTVVHAPQVYDWAYKQPSTAEVPAERVLDTSGGDQGALASTLEATVVSLLASDDDMVTAYGCRCLARMAMDGKRKRLLQCGATHAALTVLRRSRLPPSLLLETLTVLLNVSSEATNQVWLAANGLWPLVLHAFAPSSDLSGRLASAALINLAMNGANKPIMYCAELRLKTATWQALAKHAQPTLAAPHAAGAIAPLTTALEAKAAAGKAALAATGGSASGTAAACSAAIEAEAAAAERAVAAAAVAASAGGGGSGRNGGSAKAKYNAWLESIGIPASSGAKPSDERASAAAVYAAPTAKLAAPAAKTSQTRGTPPSGTPSLPVLGSGQPTVPALHSMLSSAYSSLWLPQPVGAAAAEAALQHSTSRSPSPPSSTRPGLRPSDGAPPSTPRPHAVKMVTASDMQQRLRESLGTNFTRVVDLFRELDVDGNGKVRPRELRKALSLLGHTDVPAAEVDRLFASLDRDGDGQIEYRELHLSLGRPLHPSSAKGAPPSRPRPHAPSPRAAAVAAASSAASSAAGSPPLHQRSWSPPGASADLPSFTPGRDRSRSPSPPRTHAHAASPHTPGSGSRPSTATVVLRPATTPPPSGARPVTAASHTSRASCSPRTDSAGSPGLKLYPERRPERESPARLLSPVMPALAISPAAAVAGDFLGPTSPRPLSPLAVSAAAVPTITDGVASNGGVTMGLSRWNLEHVRVQPAPANTGPRRKSYAERLAGLTRLDNGEYVEKDSEAYRKANMQYGMPPPSPNQGRRGAFPAPPPVRASAAVASPAAKAEDGGGKGEGVGKGMPPPEFRAIPFLVMLDASAAARDDAYAATATALASLPPPQLMIATSGGGANGSSGRGGGSAAQPTPQFVFSNEASGRYPSDDFAHKYAPQRHVAAWPHLEGSRYAEGVFPSPVPLPDGTSAHLYSWGERTYPPVAPCPEASDAFPVALSALGMALPPPPPPPPSMADPPGALRPKSPAPTYPLSHTLPVDPHICLGAACTLFGSLPGEHLVFTTEEYKPPPTFESMVGAVPSIDGLSTGPMSVPQLDESLFYQRKRWADGKDYHDTPRLLNRMFDLDWRRALDAGLLPQPNVSAAANAEAPLEEEDVHEVKLALSDHKALVYAAYYHYAAVGAAERALIAFEAAVEGNDAGVALVDAFGEDHGGITFKSWSKFTQQCALVSEEGPCTPNLAEATFVWATREDPKPSWAAKREAAAKAAAKAATAKLVRLEHGEEDEGALSTSLATLGVEDPTAPPKSLYRYQFVQCLVKLAVATHLGYETEDVAEALEKLLQEQLAPALPGALPAHALPANANEWRETTLYSLEIEGVLRTHLESLSVLFGEYARGGPGGKGELLSLPEWLSMLSHLDLYDAEFTPRDATLIFFKAGSKVVDEIKGRVRLLHLCLVDFFEALVRVALLKRLPTPELLQKAGRRRAGEYFLELRAGAPELYASFLRSHAEQAAASGNPVGMRPHAAFEALVSVVSAVIRNSAAAGSTLLPDEVARFKAKAREQAR